MNKFIEREKEIRKKMEILEHFESEMQYLEKVKDSLCKDSEIFERDIRELEDRIDECEDNLYKKDEKIRELETSIYEMDIDDMLPNGESIHDIVFIDDIDDHVKDYLDYNLEDFVKDINSKEVSEAVDCRLEEQANNLEFNETIMNAIMRGIARKIYNLIASV